MCDSRKDTNKSSGKTNKEPVQQKMLMPGLYIFEQAVRCRSCRVFEILV